MPILKALRQSHTWKSTWKLSWEADPVPLSQSFYLLPNPQFGPCRWKNYFPMQQLILLRLSCWVCPVSVRRTWSKRDWGSPLSLFCHLHRDHQEGRCLSASPPLSKVLTLRWLSLASPGCLGQQQKYKGHEETCSGVSSTLCLLGELSSLNLFMVCKMKALHCIISKSSRLAPHYAFVTLYLKLTCFCSHICVKGPLCFPF